MQIQLHSGSVNRSMQPTDSAKDAPVLRGFRLPSDQSADPSRETATSFDSQPPEANKPHQIPPLNPVLNQSNDRNGDNGLAELKGFRLGDFENSREAAVSFAAVYRSDSLIPNVQTGSKSSDVPAPRPLKSPPDQLRKRANPDPPVLKGFRLAPDEAHARDPAVGFYRGSSPGTEESSGSTALSPSSVGVSSSSSQPPTRNGSAQAPKQGGDLETPVLRGFRLPDGGPSSPPTRDAAVSFDGPPSPAVISHRSLLRPVTEDPASAPDVGLSIVLTADSPSNPSLRNSYSSPKTRNPGTASPANRAITNQGEGLGGLPKGRLTWNDVINGASEEDVDARTGKGLSEAGADGAADADCGGETDDVSDRGGGTEGEVCKRVVAEGDEVTLAARARKGGGDDITTVEVGPLSESRSGRTDVKLTANAERGVPKGVPASGGKLEVEHEGGLNGGGGMEEDGMERLQRNSSESRRPGETTGRSAGIIGGDWHEEGEVSTQLTRGTGTGHKVMGEDGTGITPGERDWSRPELKGLQRSPDGKGPDLRPQKEWTDSHNDVNEPVISAARAFSPKAKAPALGSPFRDEGVHFGREASRSPSFERLPSFSDREGSEVVSAAKAFSPKGGGRTRLGLPASHETEGIGGKSGQQDIDGEEHEAHKKADGNVESNVEIAATPESGGLQASNESGETALSLAEKSTGAAIESSGGDRGQGSVGGADGKEQRTGVLKSGAKPGTVGEESGKRVLKGGILEGEGKDSEKEPSQRGSEVAEPVLASETVLPMGEPESKHNAAPFAAKAPAAPKGPGERPRPKRRPRKPEDNGPVADTRASETPDGLTLLAAQYEDLPPPRGPPAKPVQATRLLPREEASKADGDVEVVVDRGEEPRRHNGGPESGSPAAERTQRDANPPEKHSQPEPRLVESGVENRGRTGEALDGSSNTLQIGTEWPRKQKQLRPRPPDTTPESPPEVRESGASRKQATKPSNPISAPPSIPLVRSGERGLTQQQNANPPAEHLSRPRDSENAAAGKSRPGPEESGGVTNQANLRPVKTSRPASSGQQRPRSQPLSPTPATKPPPTSKAPASDAAAQQAVRNSSDDPEPLRAPELSVSPRIVPTNRPKPQTAPAAGSTPRKVPRGNDVASCPPSDNPQASDASPKALPRSSHVVLSLPAGSDTPRSSDAPPADPYLLSEPYKPSTYGDPARPASGGRPLTAERPPSAGSARYTYSERPVSAERWVAPSESETLTHLPNPSENLPENYARAFPTEMGHVLPLQFSGTPPTLGHVAAPHWPLALGPDGQFVRSSSEGFGAVASLNPHGLPPFLDPHQQLQAQFMQQYPGVSFAPPGLANPYGNPLSRPENAPPTHSYAPGLSHPTAQSQEFPHPQSQPQNGLNQTPFAHLQGALNPFGSFPNPGLQYSPFSHPYFPYGIPPPFYTQTPPMFPFASASGPLNQTLQTGTMQGVPFAGTLVPPPEPRPTSRQGLDRSVSSRSELLKARDIAIQVRF